MNGEVPGQGGWCGYVELPLVAVCIDKDKNSQNALKWAIHTLVHKGQTIVLVHVNTKGTSNGVEDATGFKQPSDPHLKDLFRPFRCFCASKGIQCKDVVLDDHDVAKSIIKFSAHGAIEKLVVSATTRGGFFRFKADIPTTISKGAPDFCTLYVINKGKVASQRNSIRQAPRVSPLRSQLQSLGAAGEPPEPLSTPAGNRSGRRRRGAVNTGPTATERVITSGLNLSSQTVFETFCAEGSVMTLVITDGMANLSVMTLSS